MADGGFWGSPTGLGVVTGGANVLESLAARLFDTRDPERIKRLIAWMKERMGRDVISRGEQGRLSQQMFMAGAPERSRFAEGVNRRLDLDSGLAQQALMRNMASQRYAGDVELGLLNKRLTSQRDRTYMPTIAQLEAQIYG